MLDCDLDEGCLPNDDPSSHRQLNLDVALKQTLSF